MDQKKIVLMIVFIYVGESLSARILGIFPTPSISHQVVFRALMEELSLRGHQVTTMTTDPVKRNTSEYTNLTEIDVGDISYPYVSQLVPYVSDVTKPTSGIKFWTLIHTVFIKMVEDQLNHPAIKIIIRDPNANFELCFFESLVPLVYGFAHRFNCSVILMSSFSGNINTFNAFGNPSNPILYPDITSHCAGDCGFFEKLREINFYLQYQFYYYWKFLPNYNDVAKKYFGKNMKPLEDIEKNADMLFLNCNPILSGVRPVVPGIVYLGRLHLKPAKPLPHKIQDILDGSKNVIYFSLGSNVQSSTLDGQLISLFLEAFEELPYTVIWKWETDTLPNKPKNVHTFKWLPQYDIFNHSNVKAFITQGGLQSMDEAISKQIPMIVMPVFADQYINRKIAVGHGIGIGIDLLTITKNIFKSSIIDIIENPKYKNNIIKLSNLMVDQPQTSMERAVWWTEYVIRNKGAKHLRSPSADSPFYYYFLLDVIAFLTICISITVLALYYIIKTLYCKFTVHILKLKKS